MAEAPRKTRYRFWLWLIRFISLVVPRRLRADWRREWEAELRHREEMLAEWDRLDWGAKFDLLGRSASAFWDALLLQPKRLEDEMFQDLRFGLRMLLKRKGFTAVAVITLALGIGANTAIFSVMYGVLLKSLPFPEAERLVVLNEASKSTPVMSVSYLNLRDWQSRQTVFENLTAYLPASFVLTGAGEPERISGRFVTANFFATLGVWPAPGRAFTEDEDRPGGERVVILSRRVWEERFNGDPQLIGRTIQLNRQSFTVVGVAPADFDFYGRRNLDNGLFLPMGLQAEADYMRDRDAHPGIYAVGRLKPGVTVERARVGMKALAARLADEYPKENSGHTVDLRTLFSDYIGAVQRPLWIMQAAVGLVLLIACANVANLMLARAASRRREIAVRMALGAGRARVTRQLLTESLLLASAGGALGAMHATWGVRLLMRLAPDGLPRLDEVGVDWRVLGFTLLLTLLTGVSFGLAPALQTAKTNVHDTLKDGGLSRAGGGGHLRGALVVAEVALSLLLLIGAGLLARSFWRVLRVDPGFDAENILTMRVQSPDVKAEKMLAFYEEAMTRVAALPGVRSVSLTNVLPLGSAIVFGYSVEGQTALQPGEEQHCIIQSVSPAYLQVFGIGLLSGRYFTPQDNATSPPVVVVDDYFARKHFPTLPPGEVVGKRVLVGGDKMPWRDIVGVVRTMASYLDESVATRRFTLLLLGLFALLALSLGAVGIYGVMAYTVTRRAHEIGIRMALGAQTGAVLKLVVRQGLTMVFAGVALGLIGAFALTRVTASLLFEVSATDPLTFVIVPSLLLAVAALACWLPARRATRVDPMVALRHE